MIEEKLTSLGISLPIPPEPAGSYVPVILSSNLAFVAGQIPTEGKQVKFRGRVDSIAIGQEAALVYYKRARAIEDGSWQPR